MSYDNNDCVCGNRKERETMLCADCEAHVAGSDDAITLADEACPVWLRRAAAIRILATCRSRPGRRGRRNGGDL